MKYLAQESYVPGTRNKMKSVAVLNQLSDNFWRLSLCNMLFHLWAILLLGSNLLQRAESFGLLPPSKLHLPLPISPASATISLSNKFIRRSWFVTGNTGIEETIRDDILNDLLELIRSTPSNSPTSIQTTDNILTIIRKLEGLCPTEDAKVLPELGGNWELLWTSQDQQSDEWRLGPLRTWIKYAQYIPRRVNDKPSASSRTYLPFFPHLFCVRFQPAREPILQQQSRWRCNGPIKSCPTSTTAGSSWANRSHTEGFGGFYH